MKVSLRRLEGRWRFHLFKMRRPKTSLDGTAVLLHVLHRLGDRGLGLVVAAHNQRRLHHNEHPVLLAQRKVERRTCILMTFYWNQFREHLKLVFSYELPCQSTHSFKPCHPSDAINKYLLDSVRGPNLNNNDIIYLIAIPMI